MTKMSAPVDGFRLAYDDHLPVAAGLDTPTIVCLHGWPGDRHDYQALVPMLTDVARVVVPDLRGFGESDKLDLEPKQAYSADAQARSILALLDELGVTTAYFVGYDVGSRLVQFLMEHHPDRARGAVVTPPLPGAGARMLAPEVQQEFWYQVLHRLPLADALVDGSVSAARAYIGHFWEHWSAPDFVPPSAEIDRLAQYYGEPGAFRASIGWYRSRVGAVAGAAAERPPVAEERVRVPVEVVWPAFDPLFSAAWSDRLGEWFADFTLTPAPQSGHFVPVEAPELLAQAVHRLLART